MWWGTSGRGRLKNLVEKTWGKKTTLRGVKHRNSTKNMGKGSEEEKSFII